jgi:hypothetical protein
MLFFDMDGNMYIDLQARRESVAEFISKAPIV